MPPCNCHPPFPRPEPFSPLPRPGKVPDWGKWIRDRLAEKGALLVFPTRASFPNPGAWPNLYLDLETGAVYRWDREDYSVLVDPREGNDVLVYDSVAAFPDEGEQGKLYIAANTGSLYRWGGEGYVALLPGKADKAVPQTVGNFAALTQDGNLADSKKKPADFATAEQGAKADTAVQPAAIAGFVDDAEYDAEYGAPPKPTILLKHGSEVVATVDATDFVIDGMVSNVEVKDGNLVITFNTDSGKQPISIPLTDIFDPDNYYTKTDVNGLLAGKVSKSGDDMSGDLNVIGSETRMIRVGWNKTEGGSWAGFNQTGIFRNGTANYLKLAFPPKGGIFARLNDIADVFSPSTTYAKDSLCIYPDGYSNGVLYRCKNPNGHTGAWVAADFEEAPVEVVLAGKASKADATLTPIYSDTPTFSEWTCKADGWVVVPESITYDESGTWTFDLGPEDAPIQIPGDEYSTELTKSAFSSTFTATRVRTDVIGYQLGSQTDKPLAPADPLLFAQYYPDGSVKSAAEFTPGIKYNDPDTANRTITVKTFCNNGTATNNNSNLSGRVVIPPFVDAQGNGYISDDGTRYKVSGITKASLTKEPDAQTNTTGIVAPTTVLSVGDGAFYACAGLASVSLPAAETVEAGAFGECASIVAVSLPSASGLLGDNVFAICKSLRSVYIPYVDDLSETFIECTALESVDFGDTPRSSVPSLSPYAFSGVPTSCRIIVPDAQYDAWTAASGWSSLVTQGYKFLKHSEWEFARKYEVDKKADKPSTFTTGNLAKFDANGNPTDSGVKASDKLDSTSAAPAFSSDSSTQYAVGSHVTYNGKLYKCTTATTGGTWVAGSWTEDTMTDPDAVLDVTSQNQLRVVAKDGTVLWAQGYDLASTSSATLACDATNNFTFADGATTQAFALPTAPTGKVGDFGLDIDNSVNTGAVTISFTNITNNTASVVIPKGENLNDMLAIAAGELARFYITLSTFRVNNLPTWHIVKQIVENGGAQS